MDKDREAPDEERQPQHRQRDDRDECETGDQGPEGAGQEGTSEPQPGVGKYQGGGIEDAIGGGQSGQGGG